MAKVGGRPPRSTVKILNLGGEIAVYVPEENAF